MARTCRAYQKQAYTRMNWIETLEMVRPMVVAQNKNRSASNARKAARQQRWERRQRQLCQMFETAHAAFFAAPKETEDAALDSLMKAQAEMFRHFCYGNKEDSP